MFNPVYFENSVTDGFGVLEILDGFGEATVAPDGDDARRFAPLKMSHLRGEITGPLATLRLTQVFHYTTAECDKTLEAVYRFPLPGDAAVTGVNVRFGEVTIAAELTSRADAEAAYAAAKVQGQQAALASRESADVFTLLVAGIQPDQPIEVETRYVQLARSNGTEWRIRIPLTTPLRYLRADEMGSIPARGQPLITMRDPGHRFRLNLIVEGADVVSSPTHDLRTERLVDKIGVTLATGEVLPDRDCVLAWRLRQPFARPVLDVHTHVDPAAQPFPVACGEPAEDQLYFLAAVAPPPQAIGAVPIPREIILLVDHSGSMMGAKWAAADWAVERFLGELQPYDSFALGIYHSTTHWFAEETQRADGEQIKAAVAWLQENKESGGTELGVALEAALHLPRTSGEVARHVLIITDAAVTDAARILRIVEREAARPTAPRRISVLCIDAAPNAYLANTMATRGGGVAKFLTSAPEAQDITTALDELLTLWAAPQLLDLRLGVDRFEVTSNRRAAEGDACGWDFLDLGNLAAGQMMWVNGRAPVAGRDTLSMRLLKNDNATLTTKKINLIGAPAQPALKALFGAQRINELEYLINADYDRPTLITRLDQLGYNGAAVMGAMIDQVYAENQRQTTADALRALLVQEALDYGLPSSETSFVAVREEAGNRIEGTVPVANALPAGWSDQALTASGIATGIGQTALPVPIGIGMGGPSFPVTAPQPSTSFMPGPPLNLRELTIFAGVPNFVNDRALLFDSANDETVLTTDALFTQVRAEFAEIEDALNNGGNPLHNNLSRAAKLLIFVGDLAEARAAVQLHDLMRYGARPLNVRRRANEIVRVELIDPRGALAASGVALDVMMTIS